MMTARNTSVRRRAGARSCAYAAIAAVTLMLAACSSANLPKVADAPPTPQPEKQTNRALNMGNVGAYVKPRPM